MLMAFFDDLIDFGSSIGEGIADFASDVVDVGSLVFDIGQDTLNEVITWGKNALTGSGNPMSGLFDKGEQYQVPPDNGLNMMDAEKYLSGSESSDILSGGSDNTLDVNVQTPMDTTPQGTFNLAEQAKQAELQNLVGNAPEQSQSKGFFEGMFTKDDLKGAVLGGASGLYQAYRSEKDMENLYKQRMKEIEAQKTRQGAYFVRPGTNRNYSRG